MTSPTPPHPTSYIIIISGTHVTGKDTLVSSLSTTFHCPALKGEYCYSSAWAIARSREKHGYDRDTIFGQTWLRKMNRIGLLAAMDSHSSSSASSASSSGSDSGDGDGDGDCDSEGGILAVVSCFAMRKPSRDAIREIMLAQEEPVGVIFVVLQIERETLVGRTLGAENQELALRILEEKVEDIRVPVLEEEPDTLVVDGTLDVDSLAVQIGGLVRGILVRG
ncbi:hypothetical protein BO71DRAFT_397366 [Aspergillus ellipticus CBS 707.79]|uniref:P-loop containing nucleoside triphosphate hydrolase protein n=1 Tax=Aspergillus ellipticus CBS 707.79 TaxID=1448320 RepID=A0A319EWU9_9EURO|nr:hypothetical protein BO71DRAFT_397366 [Aspergillus ellipticus CBS 707.79]